MLKIALFNDTSTKQHFGCDAVMDTLRQNVASRNGAIIYSHPVLRAWSDNQQAVAAIEAADIVIVNGEGTLHHSRFHARELAKLGPYCAERGKLCHLISALVQENDSQIMADLARFTSIWTRDERSLHEVSNIGALVRLSGDLSFWHQLPSHAPSRDILVVDSELEESKQKLGSIASAWRAPYIMMRYDARGMKYFERRLFSRSYRLDKPRSGKSSIRTFTEFADFIRSYRGILTGRFHATCFAVNCRIPFSTMPAPGWKIEALIEEMGLSRQRLTTVKPAPFSDAELSAIGEYVGAVRSRIQVMFDTVIGHSQVVSAVST